MARTDSTTERKTSIINATIECITQYGYNNFSMQDIAYKAHVSKGIIHYYFLNKEDLMMAVLEKVSADIESLLQAKQDVEDPIQQLIQILDICFLIVKEKKAYYCINMDFWIQINQNPNIRSEIAKHYSKFRACLIHIIKYGVQKGVFKSTNPIYSASLILAIVDGIALQWLFDNDVFPYNEVVKASQNDIIKLLT
jgi:TetR/AcrR family transcriptional regulator, fatty acid metabolism regulator protein